MNILLLTPTPPDDLHRIRALQILKAMARKHSITLLTFVRDERDRTSCEAVAAYCTAIHMVPFSVPRALVNCALALPTPLPLRVAFSNQPAMQQKVNEILRDNNFDLVYVKRKRMGQYLQNRRVPRRILDLTDAVALYYQRSLKTVSWLRYPVHFEEYITIRRYEPMISRFFDRAIVCSRVDADYLQQQAEQAGQTLSNLRVIPNVVDTDFYRPDPTVATATASEATLLFSGLMDKHVNVDAARYLVDDIFPGIQKQYPNARLFIVGPKPVPEVRAMEKKPGVTVTGYVDDLRDYINRASVVLCPVRVGAGTRNKILQALSMQRPVVSTPLGAEGLEYEAGRELLIASDAAEFTRQTLKLLGDPQLSTRLAQNGRQLVQERYSVITLSSLLEDLFAELDVQP